MMKKKTVIFCLIFVSSIFSLANADIVLKWNQAILNAIIAEKTPPPIASRALAIVHTSMYDAWSAYTSKSLSTTRGNTLRRPKSERTLSNKEIAISFAAYRALADLFPNQVAQFNALMNELGYNPADSSLDPSIPSGMGNLAAFEVLSWRHQDGSNQLGNEPGSSGIPYSDYTGYTPENTSSTLNKPSFWQPLNINGVDQKFLTPQWGLVVPFSLISGGELVPPPCATYPSKRYNSQAREVLKLSATLNDQTKSIAEYWADGSGTVTPPGHWNLIAQYISERDGLNLNMNVKLFFALNNGLMDAGIAAWFTKVFYDSIRPISAIHFLFNGKEVEAWGGPGQGTQLILGQNWKTYIATPPFAEYISGHSTFSSAAAKILKLFTGSNFYGGSVVIKKGSSTIEPGITPTHDVVLHWETFSDAAKEAGMSRLYGGIHFMDGNLNGLNIGNEIGKRALDRALYYINGVQIKGN